MRVLILPALIALVAGCSNQPIATSQAEPVPKSRMLSNAYATPGKDTGTLIVKRDSGLAGAGCNWTVAVNGADIASMATSEIITVYPPAGEVWISTRPTATLCPGGVLETSARIEPGKVKAFRIGMEGLGSTFRLQPTAP